MHDGQSESAEAVDMTISSGPSDILLTGNVAALDLLVDAIGKAKREGWAEITEDGRVLVTIHRKGASG